MTSLELLTCELCGQQPESIAFDRDECRAGCPFMKADCGPKYNQPAMTVYCRTCGSAMMAIGTGDQRRFECAKCPPYSQYAVQSATITSEAVQLPATPVVRT